MVGREVAWKTGTHRSWSSSRQARGAWLPRCSLRVPCMAQPACFGRRRKNRMSEYQYHEFQAIDRPLDEAGMESLRKLTSRGKITRTSMTCVYNYGDFSGNAETLMDKYFDAHLY